MAEIEETKKGEINVFCDCGLVHKITEDATTGDLLISTKYKKKVETDEQVKKVELKKDSFFSRHYEKNNEGKK